MLDEGLVVTDLTGFGKVDTDFNMLDLELVSSSELTSKRKPE